MILCHYPISFLISYVYSVWKQKSLLFISILLIYNFSITITFALLYFALSSSSLSFLLSVDIILLWSLKNKFSYIFSTPKYNILLEFLHDSSSSYYYHTHLSFIIVETDTWLLQILPSHPVWDTITNNISQIIIYTVLLNSNHMKIINLLKE